MGLLNKFRSINKQKGVEREVADNLASIFNMKQNFGAWQRGLGLEGYSNISSYTGAIKEIISDIEYNISHFEKRAELLGVELFDVSSVLYLKFQIKCKIGKKFHSFYVGFTNYPEPISVEEEERE